MDGPNIRMPPLMAITAALAATQGYRPSTLTMRAVSTSFPRPRKNHFSGMRRKARTEGRRCFVVGGRRRGV